MSTTIPSTATATATAPSTATSTSTVPDLRVPVAQGGSRDPGGGGPHRPVGPVGRPWPTPVRGRVGVLTGGSL